MRFLVIVVILLFLGGCAGNNLIDRGSKALPTDKSLHPVYGHYKVGKPYQIDGRWYYPRVNYSYDETGIASWYGEPFHGRRTANGAIFDMHKVSAAHKTLPLPSYVEVTNLTNGKIMKILVNDRGPYVDGRIIDLSRKAAEKMGFRADGTALVRVRILADASGLLVADLQQEKWDKLVELGKLPGAVPVEEVESATLPPLGEGAEETSEGESDTAIGVGAVASAASGEVNDDKWDFSEQSPQVRLGQIPDSALLYIQAGAFAKYENALRVQRRLRHLASAQVRQLDKGDSPLFRVRLGPFDDVEAADIMLAQVRARGYDTSRIVIITD